MGSEGLRFNERILMDIMYMGNQPVLHIVDEVTHFSAATFLTSASAESVWTAFIICWASIYSGLPNRILTDQGSKFGEKFIQLARFSDVEVDRTGIEAHSSLVLAESYHGPLRTTYPKLLIARSKIDKGTALACAVKEMNDTLGSKGLVPSVLVFGEYPRVSTPSEATEPRSTISERPELAEIYRMEMQEKMAKLKLKMALHHAVPLACDRAYEPSDKVLVWREKVVNNRIGEWLGPYEVDSMDTTKKLVFVKDVKVDPASPFKVVQVELYFDS